MGHHLLLLPLVYLTVATMRDDLLDRRIYNRRLLQGLGIGAAAYAVLLVAEWAGAGPLWCSGPAPSRCGEISG